MSFLLPTQLICQPTRYVRWLFHQHPSVLRWRGFNPSFTPALTVGQKFVNQLLRFFVIISIACGCAVATLLFQPQPAVTVPNVSIESAPRITAVQDPRFKKHFQDLGVDGSMIIYDLNKDRTYQHNPQRNQTAFLPASTFKILNSLISLETQVIPNELAILTWDGIDRKLPEWNRDLNMKEAMKVSAVWFYQVLARRVGHEQMQKWITQVGYGNQKIGGKEDIDKFWLEGKLQITPQAQIQFLRRLYKGDLPFAKRSIATVKEMMIVEQTPDYIIRGKTGTIDNPKAPIGWYVGYLEQGKNPYFFATNIDVRTKADAAARKEVTRRCLKDLALL
jgi:beta-lactamase class D